MVDPVKKPLFGGGDVTDAPGIPGFESRPGKKPNTGELFELKAEGKLKDEDGRFLYPPTKEFLQAEARSTNGLWNLAVHSPVGTFFSGLRRATIRPAAELAKFQEFNFTPDQIANYTQAGMAAQVGGIPSPFQSDFFTNIVQNPTTPYDEMGEVGLFESNNYGSKEHLYKERIDKLEKEKGRSLQGHEKTDIFMEDFMETPHIAVETLALTLELLVPATATEQLAGKAVVGIGKTAGKPVAKFVNKGKKKILEGWGEIIDRFKPEHVEEMRTSLKPVSDLTDDELWKTSANFKVIDEYFDDQLDYLARGAEGDSIHTPTLEEIAGKPRDEWSATDINDLQFTIREGRQEGRLYYEAAIEEALNRDQLGTVTVLSASTGRPMNGLFFTGSGRQSVEEISDKGTELTDILGDAVYAKTTKTSAAKFGPNIDVVDVHINNSLVITGDRHWNELAKQADIENYMPNDIEEVEKLRRFVLDSGYDGVIIRPRNPMDSPNLINMFGADETIIKLGESAKNPAKFNEIFGYIPDEGTIGIGRLLKLVQADNQFSRNELVNMLDELVESGAIVKNADGTISKGTTGKATQADIPATRSTDDIYDAGFEAIEKGDATTPHPLYGPGSPTKPQRIQLPETSTKVPNADDQPEFFEEFLKSYGGTIFGGRRALSDNEIKVLRQYMEEFGFTRYGSELNPQDITGKIQWNLASNVGSEMYLGIIPTTYKGTRGKYFVTYDFNNNTFQFVKQPPDFMRKPGDSERLANYWKQVAAERGEEFTRYGKPHDEAVDTLTKLGIMTEIDLPAQRAITGPDSLHRIFLENFNRYETIDEAVERISKLPSDQAPYYATPEKLLENEQAIMEAGMAAVERDAASRAPITPVGTREVPGRKSIYKTDFVRPERVRNNHLTGWFDENVEVDIEDLIDLPGSRGEHKMMASEYSQKNIAELTEDMREKGWRGGSIMIFVERDGSAAIGEGNHRVRAAYNAGIKRIPAEIKYFGNSNQDPNIWGRKYIDRHSGPEQVPVDGNPAGVPAEIARAADEHPVNRTGPTEPTHTTKKTTEEPDPNRMNPPPDYDEPVTRMWHTKGNRETMAERRNRITIRLNELFNDTYWGVRHLQTLLEKAKSARPTKERTNLIKQYKKTRLALENPKLAEKDRAALAKKLDSLDKQIDDTAPEPGMSLEEIQRDLNFIREVTLAPGAINVGITRAQMVIDEILKVSKNIMPNDLNSLLFLRRADDLLRLDPQHVFPIDPSTGKALDYDALAKQVRSMENRMTGKEREDLWEAADKVIEFYARERDRLVARGIISKELAAYFAKHHPNYNPMRYVAAGIQNPIWKAGGYKPFTNRNNTLIKNSEADLKDWAPDKPLDLIFETAIRNESIGTRNELARIMVKLQLEWEKLPGTEQITKRVAIGKGENVIEFFENGRHYRYEVPAWMKREADYMVNSHSGMVDTIMGAVNGVSRAAFTSLSPVFIPVNAMADTLTALSTQGLLPHRTVMELVRTLKGLRNDNVALSHKLTGAYQMRYFGSTGKSLAEGMGINTQMSEEQIAKALKKKVEGKWVYEGKPIGQKSMLKKLNNIARSGFGLSTIGEATEQAPRRALFKREVDKALGKGWEKKWTPEEIAQMPVARKAAAESIEVTLNFARGGLIPKLINPWLIFFNAGAEGFKLPFRVLRDNPKARKTLGYMIAAQMSLTAYNMQYPEYYDVPSWKRWGGLIFMLPPKKKKPNGAWEAHYVEIAPYRQLSLPLGGTAYTMEKFHRESPESFTDFLTATGKNSTPLFAIPTIPVLEEIGEQAWNKDMYRQQPIVPPEIAGEPRAKQVMPWTSRTMKEIGESIDVSPERLDHAGTGIAGGVYSSAISVTDYIIELIDPEKVLPETARIFAEYEAIDDYQKKKDYYAKLNPEQRKNLDFELRKPEPYTRSPGLGPISKRFYKTGGSGISQAAQKEAERVTGISAQDTRSIYAKMNDENDKHLNQQQGLDADILSGEIDGRQWRKGRSLLGHEYQTVLEHEAGQFPKSAQAADPKDRQEYYDTITKWTKNAPDEYTRTKMLSSAYYAITLQQPSAQTLESSIGPIAVQTLIPDPDEWEDFRMRQNEFLDSLSPEDRVLLDNEITAGYTPLEKIYYEDSKTISEYFDYSVAQLRTDLSKAQVLEKAEKQGVGSLSIAEALVMHDQLDEGLREYESYKNGDPVTRRLLYKTGADIARLLSAKLQDFRRNNYEVDKALYKWELTTKPLNPTLENEYAELLLKLDPTGKEPELKIPLLIDKRIFDLQQQPEAVAR